MDGVPTESHPPDATSRGHYRELEHLEVRWLARRRVACVTGDRKRAERKANMRGAVQRARSRDRAQVSMAPKFFVL